MADFDLTQTDQQVQNILNDAQGAMGASAQTTLTTEYVMLKDTSGVYHKILKSSFTEAIRDVLAGLLVNNDKGTTINQIAAIASGDFGSITPANLASVLGVGAFKSTDFKMLYGAVTPKSETSIPCGDGLLFIGLYSGGVLLWPTYWGTNIDVIAGAYPSGITVTKTSGSRVVIVNSPSSTEYKWVYIGFTPE